jgi:hypothetical protein
MIERNPNSPYILVGGEGGVVAMKQDLEIIYDIKTNFQTGNGIFSPDNQYLLLIDREGFLQTIPWLATTKPTKTIHNDSLYNATSSRDRKYFAVVDSYKKRCDIYYSPTMERIYEYSLP